MDVVDKILKQDNADESRKSRVAQKNDLVFNALVEAVRERMNKYNEGHPQGFGFPNAMVMSAGPIWGSNGKTSIASELKVKKNITPTTSLTLKFPISDGEMKVKITRTKTVDATIGLDIMNDTPVYDLGGKRQTADSLADVLLEIVLSSTGSVPSGQTFGFV
jgi:hypothetical protein